MLPLGLLWLVADAADVALGRQVAFMGTLQVLFLAMLGWRIYRVLLFPLLYLWLMVPAADVLVPSLQIFATEMTVAALNLLALPTTHEGILITAAGKTYSIVEECASLDFILGALAFSLVYAYLFYRSWARRAVFVAAAVAAAMLANIVRTTSIIFLTHVTDGAIDLAEDHQLYGWLIFLATILALMAVGFPFREERALPAGAARASDGRRRQASRSGSLLATAVLAVMTAGLAPAYAALATDHSRPPDGLALCAPSPQGAWSLAPDEAQWQGVAPSADLRLSQGYAHGGEAAGAQVFLAYYWRQRPGVELISWQNRLAGKPGWLLLESRPQRAEIEGRALEVNEALLRSKQERRLVWHWYWVDGRFTGSRLTAKLLQAKVALLGGEPRAAFVALWTEEAGDAAAARRLLQSLAARALRVSTALRAAGPEAC